MKQVSGYKVTAFFIYAIQNYTQRYIKYRTYKYICENNTKISHIGVDWVLSAGYVKGTRRCKAK